MNVASQLRAEPCTGTTDEVGYFRRGGRSRCGIVLRKIEPSVVGVKRKLPSRDKFAQKPCCKPDRKYMILCTWIPQGSVAKKQMILEPLNT
jgi:hypothetical protein